MPRLLFRLLLLRAGPEDFPPRTDWLGGLACLYLSANALINAPSGRWREGLGAASLAMVLSAAALWLLLAWRGHGRRFLQTFNATMAVTVFFTLALAPISVQAMEMMQQNVRPSNLTALVTLLFLGWSFSVDAHILRHALEIGRGVSLLLVGLLYLLVTVVSTLLFGPVA